jgi:hypothetical protein
MLRACAKFPAGCGIWDLAEARFEWQEEKRRAEAERAAAAKEAEAQAAIAAKSAAIFKVSFSASISTYLDVLISLLHSSCSKMERAYSSPDLYILFTARNELSRSVTRGYGDHCPLTRLKKYIYCLLDSVPRNGAPRKLLVEKAVPL